MGFKRFKRVCMCEPKGLTYMSGQVINQMMQSADSPKSRMRALRKYANNALFVGEECLKLDHPRLALRVWTVAVDTIIDKDNELMRLSSSQRLLDFEDMVTEMEALEIAECLDALWIEQGRPDRAVYASKVHCAYRHLWRNQKESA